MGRALKENGAKAPLPPVDFSREMVVGCSWGRARRPVTAVEIVRAIGNSSALVVEYVETAPSRDTITAQVLTAPYHLAAIPKRDGTVTFKKV